MPIKMLVLGTAAGLVALVLQASAPALAQTAAALSGEVSSATDGPMEGVVVSAKKDGSTITVSVISDDKGRFGFPASRLDPGHYAIAIRAAGYDLDGPKETTVAAGLEDKIDVKLKPTKNLSAQLTNAEWLISMPGTDDQKRVVLDCNSCHTLERIMRSTHDAEEFKQVFLRMAGYYPGSTPLKPQRLVGDAVRRLISAEAAPAAAEWLAGINLSHQDTWSWPLKTLPRLTGKSTHVIITEYDMPSRLIEPHDVVLDHEGNVWYSDFGQMFIGELDQKTGQVTQYPIPVTKPGYSLGTLNLEFDKDDNPWIGLMYQSAIGKMDRKTGKFATWSTPKDWDSDAGQLGHLAVEGTPTDDKVWIKNSAGGRIYRLDLKSNTFEDLGAPADPRTGKRIGTYGIHADAENNLYLLDFAAGNVVRIDAKTKQPTVYLTPTPNSHPRRGRVDDQGRMWFAEYFGNAIGMLDSETGKIQEWKVPTPWSSPYDALVDKNGDAWTASMNTDRVARLDVASGQYTEYQLPRPTNIRRVFVDDSKKPGALWIGSVHGASIVKVEPLD
ncbi:MAG: carboxypeptidase regulatory-like domain-containing protein [Xanthobacteraceae bacterium]|jgi:streptogramin lyase